MSVARRSIAIAQHLVVKVGSSSLTTAAGGLDKARLDGVVDAIAERAARGTHLVLVSSGAIAAGLSPLGLARRPNDLATQQAAASVGQLALTHAYAASFDRHGLTVGQVLLTASDMVRRAHYRNAQRTFARLRGMGVIPVVNENDTVVTDEIRFGDNDRLAALVAHLVGAEGLLLLSDVDGLYDGDPRRQGAALIREVVDESDVDGVALGREGALGTGGMTSKLAAARIASSSGIPVLLAGAERIREALGTAEVGTAFAARGSRMSARRFWLRHAAAVTGRLSLDEGAVAAVIGRRRSLLAAGITAVEGTFQAGDVVELVDPHGTVVARGMAGYDAEELPQLIGRKTRDLPPELRREVVHADDLVTM